MQIEPKLYFIKDVENLVRRNRQTIRRMYNRNEFPQPYKVNNRLCWLAEDLQKWINTHVCKSDDSDVSDIVY